MNLYITLALDQFSKLPDASYLSNNVRTRNFLNSGSVSKHTTSVISFRKISDISVTRSRCRPRKVDPGSSDKATDSGKPHPDKSIQSTSKKHLVNFFQCAAKTIGIIKMLSHRAKI